MGKHYENLEEAMCKELEMLDKKYGAESSEMTVQDLEKADKLYHALKSAAAYHAMKDSEEWDEDETSGDRMGRSYGRYGRSYRRGRDAMGRYTSRDMDVSGRYPMMYPRDGYSYGYPDEWRY